MQALSMFTLAGRTLAGRLLEGALGTYYRAQSEAGEPVILFLLRSEPPGAEELARLQQAHDLQLALSRAPLSHGAQVLEPIAIVQGEDRVGLVLRHGDGEPLAHGLRRGALPVPAVLRLGIALSELCGALHERGVRLGACGPEPILLDYATGAPGDAPRVRVLSLVPVTLAGSAQEAGELSAAALPYAAPEQLRGGADLTPSADLYSLGVLLYQALCGELPFDSADPAELLHAHLARTPPPLAERAPGVPPVLARIVEKLLSKAPAERYQTAHGLRDDLEQLREQLAAGADPDRVDFALGRSDRPELLSLVLPQDARSDEEHELLRALQAATAGAPRVALLSGGTGSGKTTLAQRLHDPVRAAGGLFVEVRCQLADHTPHAALSRALRDLVRQLVREPADRRARLVRELVPALGPAAQALCVLVPELELLLEELPKAPPLEGAPAQNRLRLLVGQLLRAVARPERPLVLFFDEAQRIDAGSLRLLIDCLCASPSLSLLVVAALQAGEVGPGHPLTAATTTLRAAGVEVLERELVPLLPAQLTALLARTLGGRGDEAAALGDVLHVKTRGNLLALSQLLRTLQEDGLLRYEPRTRRWACDLGAIIGHSAGEDVQAVLVQRIGRLRDGARRGLALAACLGMEFSLGALARLGEQDPAEARALLAELQGAGLVRRLLDEAPADAGPAEERYCFLHSSVAQAALALLTPEAEAEAHLRIGRALLAGDPAALPDRVLLAGVQQLNQGASRLTTEAERAHLAELDLLAGRRAKAAAANETAAELFTAGLALLDDESRPELGLALQQELVESDFLCGRFQAADARAQALLERAQTPWEKAQVQALRARYHLPAARYKEAIQLGLHALALLGVELPPGDAELQAQAEAQLAAIGPELLRLGDAALLALPRVQDPEQRLRFTVVGLLLPPSFASRPSLFQALVGYTLGAILRHGNTEEACTAYFCYGLLQVTTGDIQRGLRFSELALRLYERLDVHRTAGMVLHIHGGHINHWGRPLNTGVELLERSIQVSMAVGDLNHIGNGAFELVWLLHERGDRLDEVERVAGRGIELARQIRNDAIRSAVQVCRSYVRCLRGEPEAGGEPSPHQQQPVVDRFCRDSAESLQRLQRAGFGPGIGTYHILHLLLRYLFGQYAEAYAAAQAAAQMLRPVQSLAIEVALHLFRGLTLVQRLAAPDGATAAAEDEDRALLAVDLEKLRRWAAACPENYAPLLSLLQAEVARLRDQPLAAEELYDQAIEGARRSGFVHYAALASELAARFYMQRGRRLIAPSYLRAAYVGYSLWGAQRKAAQLAEQHPELGAGAAAEAGAPQPLGLREALDVAAVVRIGQAIAAELNLDKGVEQLLRIALHHAGATRGALLLMHEGALHLIAQCRASDDAVESGLRVPLLRTQEVPRALVQEVAATGEPRLVDDASRDAQLASEPCVLAHGSRSVLALPLLHRSSVSGVLYLENSLSPDVFRGERLQVLGSLCAQAATALENAQLYTRLSETSEALRRANERLEREVQDRTDELRRANEQLAEELLRRTETERARAALQEEIIRVQSAQLAELSTPLVPVAESIMVLPLLGSVDARRAQDIVEAVLGEAQSSRARVVLIDVTGLRRVDEFAASLLLRVSRALRLLGSQAILTGMRPDVAQTLVSMGADLTGVVTRANLQSGIAYASELVRSMARR